MEYCWHIFNGATQSLLASLVKVQMHLCLLNCFATYNLFRPNKMLWASCCSVANFIMCIGELDSEVSPIVFTTETTMPSTRVNHPHFPRIPIVRIKFHTYSFCPITALSGIDLQQDVFRINTILTSLSLGLTFEIPAYSHENHLLSIITLVETQL